MLVKSLLPSVQQQIILVLVKTLEKLNEHNFCMRSVNMLLLFCYVGIVGSEDGHGELLAAVKGVINSGIFC